MVAVKEMATVRARLEARAAAAKVQAEKDGLSLGRLHCVIDNALWRAAARRWLHREARLRFCRAQEARALSALERREFDEACREGHAAWAVQRTLSRQAAAVTRRASVWAQWRAAEANARVVRARGRQLTRRVLLKGAIDRKLALASVRRSVNVTALRERLFAHGLRHEEAMLERREGLRSKAFQLERKLSAATKRHAAHLEVVKSKAKVEVHTLDASDDLKSKAREQAARMRKAAVRREQALEATRKVAQAIVRRQRLVRSRAEKAAKERLHKYEAKLEAAATRRDQQLASVRERASHLAGSTRMRAECYARTREELRSKLMNRLEAASMRRQARMPGWESQGAFGFAVANATSLGTERALKARTHAAREAKRLGEELARRMKSADGRRDEELAKRSAFAAKHNRRVPSVGRTLWQNAACLGMAMEARLFVAEQRRLAIMEAHPCRAMNRKVSTGQVRRRVAKRQDTLNLSDKLERAAMRREAFIRPSFAIEANRRVLVATNRLLYARIVRNERTKIEAQDAEARREAQLGAVIGRANVAGERVRTAKIYRECAAQLAAMRGLHAQRMAGMRRSMKNEFSFATLHNAAVDARLERHANATALARAEIETKLERAELRRSNASPGLKARQFNARVGAVRALQERKVQEKREEIVARQLAAQALREGVSLASIKDRAEALGSKAVEEAQARLRRRALSVQVASDAKLEAAAVARRKLQSPCGEARSAEAQKRREDAEAESEKRKADLAARAELAQHRRRVYNRSISASAGIESVKVLAARARRESRRRSAAKSLNDKLAGAERRRTVALDEVKRRASIGTSPKTSPRQIPSGDDPVTAKLAEAGARAARAIEMRRLQAFTCNRSVSRTRERVQRREVTRRQELRAHHAAAMRAAEARRQRKRAEADDRAARHAGHAAEVAARRSAALSHASPVPAV